MTMTNPDLPDLITLRDLLRYAVSRFHAEDLCFGQGSDNAWDEAVYLLLHSLSLPLDQLEPFLEARVLPHERQHFLNLVQQRTHERIPAAYLTGEAWLQGLRFEVDKRVIIPRSPISELLTQQLEPWVPDPDAVNHVLDLCTGSGCLAILASLAFPSAHVDAADLSADALAVAHNNIDIYGLAERISLYQSDLFTALSPQHYDLIICNPPYVNQSAMDALPKEFQHEPHSALAGGSNGMALVKTIVEQAGNYLTDDGLLVLEIGHEQNHFLHAFPWLDPVWLATEQADDQILLLTRSQLSQ